MLIDYQMIIIDEKKTRKKYETRATQKKKIDLALYSDCFDLRWCLLQIRPIVRWCQLI
jgi:hypothetical protein